MSTPSLPIRGTKQWLTVLATVLLHVVIVGVVALRPGDGAVAAAARLLTVIVFNLAVIAPQVLTVMGAAFFVAKPPARIYFELALLVILVNLVLVACFGVVGLLLGPVSYWSAIFYYMLFGGGVYQLARRVWHLPARLAAIPAATFVLFKVCQQVLLLQLRGPSG